MKFIFSLCCFLKFFFAVLPSWEYNREKKTKYTYALGSENLFLITGFHCITG